MKNAILVSILLFSLTVFAQKNNSTLATKIRPGIMWFYTGFTPVDSVWKPKFDRLIFDIKYNGLVNFAKPKTFNTKWNSIGFNTQFIFDIPMDRRFSSFGVGIGYEFSKFIHNQAVLPFDGSKYDFMDTSYFDKSILRTHTFFVPIEFRFRTQGWKHFKFHIGSNVGYRFGNNKTYDNGTKNRIRTGKMHNFEWLYLDVHARMGIRNWAVIASMNMLPIFKKTPQNHFPISLGISISLF